MSELAHPSRFTVLGVPISVVNMTRAVDQIGVWIKGSEARYVCAVDVHNVMRAQELPQHMQALRGAAMNMPDGQPVATLGRLLGHDVSRVCGPDLLSAVCERSTTESWRHYFYGGADGVAEDLARRLGERYPGLVVAGIDCPPFRPLSDDEETAAVERMRAAQPDIVWVGLGCPKQEMWMQTHAAMLEHGVLIGIGAAFDFHTGRVSRAPLWMREHGLEWLHRLASEPRRLWRRYLVLAPKFVGRCIAEHGLSIARARSLRLRNT